MAFVFINEAARLTGKSIPTLYRHINSGKLSQLPDKSFDTAELIRVYGKLILNESHQDDSQIEILRIKNELLEIQLQRERDNVGDLRARLDQSEAERRQLTQMLTHQKPEQTKITTDPMDSQLYRKLFHRKFGD